jgi:short-subunit dehydrogenase
MTDERNKPVLILGATSAIARGVAQALARRGYALYLAARDLEQLEHVAADLQVRYGAEVDFGSFDVTATTTHKSFLEGVVEEMGGLEGVVLAVGWTTPQQEAEQNFTMVERAMLLNYTGPVSILDRCARFFEQQHRGFIVGISSVAGDRGRQSNYYYGAAKGALTRYLEGLRNRLFHAHVGVMTVKPGFVDTATTFGMPGLFLVASPQSVGEAIVRALEKRRSVIYVPWFWRYIMLIIRHIPEFIFKRLKL